MNNLSPCCAVVGCFLPGVLLVEQREVFLKLFAEGDEVANMAQPSEAVDAKLVGDTALVD